MKALKINKDKKIKECAINVFSKKKVIKRYMLIFVQKQNSMTQGARNAEEALPPHTYIFARRASRLLSLSQ